MQQLPSSYDTTETPQEVMLRATLHDHAPKSVDTDNGWKAVAEHLFSLNHHTRNLKKSGFQLFQANGQHHSRRWRKITLMAAIALLSMLLMGAGVAASYYFWGGSYGDPGIKQIGDQHLYQDIEQQQRLNQITITITKAYADAGRTLIAYDLQVPASTAKSYNNIVLASFSVLNQQGEELAAANVECTEFPHDGSPMHCLITLSPFHPGVNTNKLTVTFDIAKVYLIRSDTGNPEILTGPWHFQFVLPFHRDNLGPGGPYAQPTHIP